MGLLSSLLDPPPRAEFKPWDDFWYQTVSGVGTTVGIPVTPLVALQVAAVFACVKVISETLATLPIIVYRRREDGGKDRATQHPLYDLLHDSPNAWQTSFEFVEDQTGHCALHGNCYAEIVPGPRGAVEELVPIRPELVTVEQLPSRRLRYQVRQSDGTKRPLTQDQVFHVRGRALDFVSGLSTQTQARDAIALARAVETYGAKFFANDASIGLVIEHPGTLKKEAQERLKEQITTFYGGVANAHKPKVLEEGMKLNRVPMTAAKDAQLTEAQESAVLVICRYFRMPPHKIQHLIHATFSNIEHQGIEFVTDTIMPWARRYEQRINASLITSENYFAEFLMTGLLRGDNAARSQFYRELFNIGGLSQNEIRSMENMNPVPGGDRFFVQGALVPVDKIDQIVNGQSRAAVKPAPEARAALGTVAAPLALLEGSAPRLVFTALVYDAAERIAQAEAREIEQRRAKAIEDPERFGTWLREYYAAAGKHAGYVARTLTPLLRSWQDSTGHAVAGEELLRGILAGGFNAPAHVDDVFAIWRDGRAEAIAVLITQALEGPTS